MDTWSKGHFASDGSSDISPSHPLRLLPSLTFSSSTQSLSPHSLFSPLHSLAVRWIVYESAPVTLERATLTDLPLDTWVAFCMLFTVYALQVAFVCLCTPLPYPAAFLCLFYSHLLCQPTKGNQCWERERERERERKQTFTSILSALSP